jgi:hypothetical protein
MDNANIHDIAASDEAAGVRVAEIEGFGKKETESVLGKYDMSVTLLFSVNLLSCD